MVGGIRIERLLGRSEVVCFLGGLPSYMVCSAVTAAGDGPANQPWLLLHARFRHGGHLYCEYQVRLFVMGFSMNFSRLS